MIFTESIYFIILFLLPAALNMIYNVHIRQVPQAKNDKSIELAECVLFSLAVFFINIMLLRSQMYHLVNYLILDGVDRVQFCTTTGFEYLDFMILYFIINLFTSIGVIILWYTLGQWMFRRIKNKINKSTTRPEELKYNSAWVNLFETNDFINPDECVIKIEKDGALITAGLIRIYSSPTTEKRDILLYNTDSIKELFEDDIGKGVNERIFPYSDYEYYDFETGCLIKIYNTEKYNEYYGY